MALFRCFSHSLSRCRFFPLAILGSGVRWVSSSWWRKYNNGTRCATMGPRKFQANMILLSDFETESMLSNQPNSSIHRTPNPPPTTHHRPRRTHTCAYVFRWRCLVRELVQRLSGHTAINCVQVRQVKLNFPEFLKSKLVQKVRNWTQQPQVGVKPRRGWVRTRLGQVSRGWREPDFALGPYCAWNMRSIRYFFWSSKFIKDMWKMALLLIIL